MTLAKARTWTVDEYHQMLACGILREREGVELLGGHIVEVSPQKPPHAATVHRAARYLARQLAGRAEVRSLLPVTLRPDSEPTPDLAIVRRRTDGYRDRHPEAADIFWTIEICESTLIQDCELKALTYARAGIIECWVLDILACKGYIFRDPTSIGYQHEERRLPSDCLSAIAFPHLPLALSELFLPDLPLPG